MTKSIPDAYAALQDALAGITGLRSTPDYPKEREDTYPYLEMGPITGEFTGLTGAPQPVGTHVFGFKIHVARSQGLPAALTQLLPFAERVANAVLYSTGKLNNTINGIESLAYELKPSAVEETETLCYDFKLKVKIVGVQPSV